MKAYIAGAVFTFLLTLTLSALALQSGPCRNPAPWQQGRPLLIGYSIEPPYTQLDAQGQAGGLLPDRMRELLQQAGIRNSLWLYGDADSLLQELEAGRIDLIAGKLPPTLQTGAHTLLSRPVIDLPPGLLTLAGNPLQLHSMLDLRRQPESRLGVLENSAAQQQAWQLQLHRVRSYSDSAAMLDALRQGKVDALALPLAVLQYLQQQSPDEFSVQADQPRLQQFGSQRIGFILHHNQQTLQGLLDQAMTRRAHQTGHLAMTGRQP